jgi:4-hydroxy-L-threonine phosphate dehydrogenase PdxA
MLMLKPVLALLPGDPCGIGPEITARYLKEGKFPEGVRIALMGDRKILEKGAHICEIDLDLPSFTELEAVPENLDVFHIQSTKAPEDLPIGQLSEEAGKYAYSMLRTSLDYVLDKKVQGLVFAPFNKQALKLGGNPEKNEFELLKSVFNKPEIHGEINILNQYWTTRVTSHIPIGEIPLYMRKERILECIHFLNSEMKACGIEPKIAVAALNPHGGEGGLCGREEIEAIEPAADEARKQGLNVHGPYPADTLFVRLKKEGINGILGMYHDQIQIPSKLMGFDQGVTLIGGLPVPVTTSSHGTAFDIAGQGKASFSAFTNAVKIAADISKQGGRNQ